MMQKPSSPNTNSSALGLNGLPVGVQVPAQMPMQAQAPGMNMNMNVNMGMGMGMGLGAMGMAAALSPEVDLGVGTAPAPATSPADPNAAPKPTRKRRAEGGGNLTVEQKRRICEKHRSTPKITQKDLCRWAKLEFTLKKAPTQPTMSNILKNEHLFKDAIGGVLGSERKTIRPTKHAHFDQVLANWVMERQNKGTITGDMIKQKGRELAKQMGLEGKLGFSNGWLASFKARHGLIKRAAPTMATNSNADRMMVGMPNASATVGMADAASAAAAAGVGVAGTNTAGMTGAGVPTAGGLMESAMVLPTAMEPGYMLPPVSVDFTLEQIQDVLREYVPSDVYTVDETGLFFRASPNRLVQGDDAQSNLQEEAKLSVLLAANADASDLMEPYIIGSILPPKHIKNASITQLGYHYVCSSKSRMTVFIFQQWLRDFNARMASAHRNVVLLMDNAPSHVLGCVNLTNVRVIMFAPHLGMKVQPMRGGILQAFKGRYRLKHLTLAIDHLEDGLSDIYRITQLQAMKWITESWQQSSKEVIINAWKPLGVQVPFPFDSTSLESDDKNVEEELWGLLYCLQLSGVVNTKVLVNNRWENDIHKRLNEDMIEDPKACDEEFRIPDMAGLDASNGGDHMGDEEGIPPVTAKEQLKAFRDVIRYLERTGTADSRDPQLLNVIDYLKKKQLNLRFDNASSTALTI